VEPAAALAEEERLSEAVGGAWHKARVGEGQVFAVCHGERAQPIDGGDEATGCCRRVCETGHGGDQKEEGAEKRSSGVFGVATVPPRRLEDVHGVDMSLAEDRLGGYPDRGASVEG